jgi:hypothetical protein
MRPLASTTRRSLLAVVLLIVLATAFAPAAHAATAADRAEADRVMRLSYVDFVALKRSANRPAQFNWTDDGCSGPGLVKPVYRTLFNKPCQQHPSSVQLNCAGRFADRLSATKST